MQDPTGLRTTKPVYHNYWACALELGSHTTESTGPIARGLQQEKPQQWEARVPQLESSLRSPQLGKSPCSNEGPDSQKKKIN